MGRDVCLGILPNATGGTTLITQGNEPQAVVDAIKLLKTYEELGETPSGNVRFTDFGRTMPPLKSLLITGLLMLITILSGMLISLNMAAL